MHLKSTIGSLKTSPEQVFPHAITPILYLTTHLDIYVVIFIVIGQKAGHMTILQLSVLHTILLQ